MREGQDDLRFPILIGDVGGTNARFAIVDSADSDASEPEIVRTASFPNIDGAIHAILDGIENRSPTAPGWCGRR